jgi:hypothetical protein
VRLWDVAKQRIEQRILRPFWARRGWTCTWGQNLRYRIKNTTRPVGAADLWTRDLALGKGCVETQLSLRPLGADLFFCRILGLKPQAQSYYPLG